ncbi:hypothetical protein RFF05_07440 [Bengtsoniella intestinalis]
MSPYVFPHGFAIALASSESARWARKKRDDFSKGRTAPLGYAQPLLRVV